MSVTEFPNKRPKRSYQGPVPTRSMALTGFPVPSSEALRKARQPLAPAPGMLASASTVQILSAPRSPAPAPVSPYLRSPPKPSAPLFGNPKPLASRCKPAQLVTKKLNFAVATTAPKPALPALPSLPALPALPAPPAPTFSEPAAALAPAVSLLPPLAPGPPAAGALPATALPAELTLAPPEPGAPATPAEAASLAPQAGSRKTAEHGHDHAQTAATMLRSRRRKLLT